MRKLIKDFRDFQFVYYWYEKGAGRISPYLPTLTHASDWLKQQQRETYNGFDRRRRNDAPAIGRRTTDRRIQVDLDISIEKIAELKESFAA